MHLEREKVEILSRKVVLDFPKELLDKPVIWTLSRRFDLGFNILRANIEDGRGYVVLELKGKSADYQRGIDFVANLGIRVHPLEERICIDKTRCTECGACVGICPTGSFTQDPETLEVVLNGQTCIACGACVKACPARAISLTVVSDQNRR